MSRTRNATRNIVFGILLRVYQLVVPFVIRTAMIYYMGVQYLGLNSLFVSVLQVLNLAELGVGAAMVYSMYRPIAEKDPVTICALMKLYKKYYRIIGFIIAVIGGAITPLIPKLIKAGEIPEGINIYILYLLNLAATVLSYWLFAYKNSVLQAHQRNDIISKVTLLTNTIQYAVQLIVIICIHNYYLFVLIALLGQALTNICTAFASDKLYPNYKATGELSAETVKTINQRIKDLFTAKIGGVVYDSADTIVISAFLGLTMLAIYQNYYYILNAITGIVTIVFTACLAGIGNSLVIETKEKNYNDLRKFTFIICWIAGFCSVCLVCLYQPFMELWVGTALMLNMSSVICFVVYFFVREINQLLNLYKDASGVWHEDRFRPLVAALTNLILNIVLVHLIGIYGVILSTVIAILFVGMPWLLHNLFTYVFHKELLKSYLMQLLLLSGVVVLSCFITYSICALIKIKLIPCLLVRACICFVVPNCIYYFAFRRTKEFYETLDLANTMTKGRFHNILKKVGKI